MKSKSHWSVLAGLGLLTLALPARAEQFVLLDVSFTFTEADADNATPSKSHYYVKSDRLNAATPMDWTKPIDYRNGRVHVRAEVTDKPAGSAETRWTLCYIARKGIDAGYGCSNTAAYKEKGVWELEQGMTEWWQNDNIDWTQGIKQMDLVMKDSKGVFAHTMPDPERWFPTTLRITMIQVSAGSTYDATQVPGSSAGGGGGGAGGSAGMSSTGGVGSAGTAGNVGDPITGGAASVAGAPAQAGGAGEASNVPLAGVASGGGGAGGAVSSAGAPSVSTTQAPTEDSGCSFAVASAQRSGFALAGLAAAFAVLSRRRRHSKADRNARDAHHA